MSTDLTTTKTQHPALANMPEAAKARGITPESWNVLSTILFKDAAPETILTLVDYCKARKLDPLKRPFHIVKVWNSETRRMEDSIWPGIGELRTTAMRTGEYAGKAKIEFGPDRTQKLGSVEITFPEWAQATVYRTVNGQRVEFAGSPVYWLETYASTKDGGPNAMWKKRPRGQLAKCAEAEALRSAFPEEVGSEPTAEEMEGQTVGGMRDITPDASTVTYETATAGPYLVELVDRFGEVARLTPEEAPVRWREWLAECRTPEEIAALAENNPELPDALVQETNERAEDLIPDWTAKIEACHDEDALTAVAAEMKKAGVTAKDLRERWRIRRDALREAAKVTPPSEQPEPEPALPATVEHRIREAAASQDKATAKQAVADVLNAQDAQKMLRGEIEAGERDALIDALALLYSDEAAEVLDGYVDRAVQLEVLV